MSTEKDNYLIRGESLLLESECSYLNNELYVEGVRVRDMVLTYGSPLYIYSTTVIERNCDKFTEVLRGLGVKVCYAMKANDRLGVLNEIKRCGLGIDVVSGGEIYRALRVGVNPRDIIFSGVGKNEQDIEYAVFKGIGRVNIEAEDEIKIWDFYARKYGREIDISFRLNPDVIAGGHDKIRTGRSTDKFGLDQENTIRLWEYASGFETLKVNGLAVHIGSQIFDPSLYRTAGRKMIDVAEKIRQNNYQVKNFDLGGGFGVRYKDEKNFDLNSLRTVIEEFKDVCGEHDNIYIEPGRAIIAAAGILVGKVNAVKGDGNLIVIDAGMHNLIRPALYNSYHHVLPLTQSPYLTKSNIVGPICESSDKLAESTWLPPLKYGDYVALMTTGAYGSVLSSHYNARGKISEILVNKKISQEIVKAQSPYHIENNEDIEKTIA